MKIRNSRMFSYPILSSMYDDYIDSEFYIKVDAQKTKNNMIITVEPVINSSSVEKLIKNGDAEMVIHFECGRTRFRTIEKLNYGQNTFEFAGEKLNGILQVVSFIIAKNDIVNYNSSSFNQEYGRASFNIEKGSIIGISNQPDIPVPKSIYDLSNITSIISVIPDDNDDSKMKIEYDETKIYIKLPSDTYVSYSSIGSEVSNATPILHSMLVVPALISILDILSAQESWIDFETFIWFKVIKKKCEEKYGEFSQKIIKENNPTIIAQELINSPITSAINNLMEMR